jgi:hypothetical protein
MNTTNNTTNNTTKDTTTTNNNTNNINNINNNKIWSVYMKNNQLALEAITKQLIQFISSVVLVLLLL